MVGHALRNAGTDHKEGSFCCGTLGHGCSMPRIKRSIAAGKGSAKRALSDLPLQSGNTKSSSAAGLERNARSALARTLQRASSRPNSGETGPQGRSGKHCFMGHLLLQWFTAVSRRPMLLLTCLGYAEEGACTGSRKSDHADEFGCDISDDGEDWEPDQSSESDDDPCDLKQVRASGFLFKERAWVFHLSPFMHTS